MITFKEFFNLSTTEPKEAPVEDFEAAVRKLVDGYKGQMDKSAAVAALRLQADLLNRDETWTETPDEGTAETPASAEEDPTAVENPSVEPEEAEEDESSGKGGKRKK